MKRKTGRVRGAVGFYTHLSRPLMERLERVAEQTKRTKRAVTELALESFLRGTKTMSILPGKPGPAALCFSAS